MACGQWTLPTRFGFFCVTQLIPDVLAKFTTERGIIDQARVDRGSVGGRCVVGDISRHSLGATGRVGIAVASEGSVVPIVVDDGRAHKADRIPIGQKVVVVLPSGSQVLMILLGNEEPSQTLVLIGVDRQGDL